MTLLLKLPRTDILITQIRARSLTKQFSDESGIGDDFFLGVLEECAIDVQNAITAENTETFVDYDDQTVEAAEEAYPVPRFALLGQLIYDVQYSRTGNEADLEPLEKASSYSRDQSENGHPEEYVVDGDQIYLQPIPSQTGGLLRVRYERALDVPDVRRGQVLARTVTDGLLTGLQVDVATVEDATALELAEYVCANDAYGTVKARAVEVSDYDASSGLFTVAHELEDGESVSVGDFLTLGPASTTHSKLPRLFLPYVMAYAQNEVNVIQSSMDEQSTDPNLSKKLAKIIDVFQSLPAGRSPIPQRRWW